MDDSSSTQKLSADEFAALLGAAVDGMIVIDKMGTIQEFNPAAEKMFGYTRTEILEKNVKMLMPYEHSSKHDGYLAHHMETGEERIIGHGREVEGLRKDGSTFPLYLSVGRVDGESAVYFVGILHDLTGRHKYESEIARQQQELSRISRQATAGELAAALAHELNQPLSAIATFSGAAQRFLANHENNPDALTETANALEQIEAQSLRAGQVIQRMRAFINTDETTRDRVSVRELIDEVMPIVLLDARAQGVAMSTSINAGYKMLDVDKIQIQQVLVNLVRNAVDATMEIREKRAPDITLRTREVDANRIEFRVTDNGGGIPDNFKEDLFTPFKSTKETGLGMGLAISNSIIEAHGDSIHFESGPEGTTFWFHLILTDS